MSGFLNTDFNAPNVFTFTFSNDLLAKIKHDVLDEQSNIKYMVVRPNWNSDIAWLSPNSLKDVNIFSNIFDQLQVQSVVKSLLNIKSSFVSYCGFLVVRSSCIGVDYHTDWIGTGLNAFTLITPLVDEGEDLGLLYKKNDSDVGKYLYKPGEAIVFADGFIHSSMPTDSTRKIILLSFTFGTDSMEYWPAISKTAGYQSNILKLPNGDFRVKNISICS